MDAPLSDLIARLEQASEGSRELDGDIAEIVQPQELQERQAAHLNMLRRCQNKKGYALVDRGRWERHSPTYGKWDAPRYTTSIEDALLLVPLALGIMWDVAKYPGESAAAYVGQRDVPCRQFEVAKTPALALSIAALKARSQP